MSSSGERSDGDAAGSDAALRGLVLIEGAVTSGGVEVAGSCRTLRPRCGVSCGGVSCGAGSAGAAAAAAAAAAVEAVEAAAAATGVC